MINYTHSEPLQELIHIEVSMFLEAYTKSYSSTLRWRGITFLSKSKTVCELSFPIRYTITLEAWQWSYQWENTDILGSKENRKRGKNNSRNSSNIFVGIDMLGRLTIKAADSWLGYKKSIYKITDYSTAD